MNSDGSEDTYEGLAPHRGLWGIRKAWQHGDDSRRRSTLQPPTARPSSLEFGIDACECVFILIDTIYCFPTLWIWRGVLGRLAMFYVCRLLTLETRLDERRRGRGARGEGGHFGFWTHV
jgi:hypothetical protein